MVAVPVALPVVDRDAFVNVARPAIDRAAIDADCLTGRHLRIRRRRTVACIGPTPSVSPRRSRRLLIVQSGSPITA